MSGQTSMTFSVTDVTGLFFATVVTFAATFLFGNTDTKHAQTPSAVVSLENLAKRAWKPATPSAYEKEAAMTPTQLLNRWNPVISEASKRFGVPENWIRAVMRRETGGRTMLNEKQKIMSPAGALGLMQVMPGTYDELRTEHALGADPQKPEDNIYAGAAYLRWLHRKYGFPAMFAAYNAGPGNLEKHLYRGADLPAETKAYVTAVTRYLKTGAATARPVKIAMLTKPNGKPVSIDATQVTGIRPALRGEYPAEVKTVVNLGKQVQVVRENIMVATTALKSANGAF